MTNETITKIWNIEYDRTLKKFVNYVIGAAHDCPKGYKRIADAFKAKHPDYLLYALNNRLEEAEAEDYYELVDVQFRTVFESRFEDLLKREYC